MGPGHIDEVGLDVVDVDDLLRHSLILPSEVIRKELRANGTQGRISELATSVGHCG